MTYSQITVSNTRIVNEVCRLYRCTSLTQQQIGALLGVGHLSINEIVKRNFSVVEKKLLKARRYRKSKRGIHNPMHGKTPANFVGECEDGHGYLTKMVDGKRYFVHRVVMAEMVGYHPSQLPSGLVVHHIDKNKKNNLPDNLALLTNCAHMHVHRTVPNTLVRPKLRIPPMSVVMVPPPANGNVKVAQLKPLRLAKASGIVRIKLKLSSRPVLRMPPSAHGNEKAISSRLLRKSA